MARAALNREALGVDFMNSAMSGLLPHMQKLVGLKGNCLGR